MEKQYVLYILSVTVALVLHHEEPMRRVILPSVACPALPYFSMLLYKLQRFYIKKLLKNKVCFDFLYNVCLKHFPL